MKGKLGIYRPVYYSRPEDMPFHRLKKESLLVRVYSCFLKCCQVEKACDVNWVVSKMEGLPRMQDDSFRAETGTVLDKLG